MASKTLRERFIAGFEATPYYKRVQTRSGKYVVYEYFKNRNQRYFIGKNGALRSGPTATESVPCSDAFKKLVLSAAGETSPQRSPNGSRKFAELAALLPIQEDK